MSYFSRLKWVIVLISALCLASVARGVFAQAETQDVQAQSSTQSAKQNLVLGVFNYLGDEVTRRQYTPIVEYLNQRLTHECIQLEVLSQEAIKARMEAGTLDFVTTNPTQFLSLRQSDKVAGVMASLIESHQGRPAPCIAGVIFTRANRHDIQKLADVSGRIVAAPGMDNFGAFRTQQYELLKAGIHLPQDVRAIRELKTHEAVVQAVLEYVADVGFVRAGTLENMEAAGRIPMGALKVIAAKTHPRCLYTHTTPTYPGWPLFALSHVNERHVGHVAAALFALEANDPTAIKAGVYGYSVPRDYTRVEELARGLRLPPYDHAPEFTVWDVLLRWKELLLAGLLSVVVIIFLSLSVFVVWRREHQARQFSQLILTSLGQGVYHVDTKGRCRFINPSALRLLHTSEQAVLGHSPHALFHHHYVDGRIYSHEDCPTWKTLQDGQVRKSEEWFWRENGEGFPAEVLVTPMINNQVMDGAVVIFTDISERKRMEAQLVELATTDALTGLHNRRYFLSRLVEGIARVKRFGENACVIMLDCDHFKIVNDTYGHAVGDEVLRGLAEILRQNARQTDVVGRVGGEEFAVLLNDTTFEFALDWAERVRHMVAGHVYNVGGEGFFVTISLGCAALNADDSENSVLLRADQALYQAKLNGRNRVEWR